MATIKQKKAIANVVENHGNVSKAMRDAGYPEITAKNPKNLTESKAWKEIMEEQLPDELLMEVHKEGLQADKVVQIDGEMIDTPDYAVRHKYLDTAYKLKGSYAPEKTQTLTLDLTLDLQDPKTKELADKYAEELRQHYLS